MSTIEFDGQAIPLSSFSKIIIQKGQPALFNPELKLMIPFDIDDQEQLASLGISDITAQQVKLQLERDRQVGMVPDEYKNKFCAIFGGKVFYSFDTKEQLDAFIKEGTCENLMMSYYYPANSN